MQRSGLGTLIVALWLCLIAPAPGYCQTRVPLWDGWRLVAASDTIVCGKIVKVKEAGKSHRRIVMEVDRTLRGKARMPSIEFPVNKEVVPPSVLGKRVIAFLSDDGQPVYVRQRYRFDVPIIEASQTLLAAVGAEMKNQEAVIRMRFVPTDPGITMYLGLALYEIGTLPTIGEESEVIADELAYEIRYVGLRGVPTLVFLMSDYRYLPRNRFRFPTPREKFPDAWEGEYTTIPEMTVDLVNYLLFEITGTTFGGQVTSNSRETRARVCVAWRVFVYYTYPEVRFTEIK